ncbi:MAG: hypothetical protein UT30_C0008G0039 [Candidatus Uhrbacteria bacterium GW2011_GWF2_39_13]|uniref:Glycoside hydrolase family 42 N-terminal domain-containing protein n=1 Tax=Candidatus Uhrbacteria bacterium GW2011_GWF2_39_13 TaxID=1618995 RepID=A0A0G0QRZ9_9BACT|nr:MAG: hypothetical protein UT30_C0008G0039 [Candidatus Uhrbacteria bacterium GW2011_GWF2_39_13]
MITQQRNDWWKNEGIYLAGGWHPLAGRLRAGNALDNEEELYEWEYSEERIARLKLLGINLIVGQFDRGLSDTDQKEEQEKARQLAELCHKHNMKHGVYLANTVYFESMLKDYPDCEDWVVHTHDNRFVHYGGEQSWRWVACFNSPGWREHMKKQIEKAVNYVKTDLLHFDNLAVWPEPDSCHCRYCQEKFREFLRLRYPSENEQKKRFGFGGFETFRAPNFYLRFLNPWELERIKNPLMQEWIEFRCDTVTDYIKELSEYAKKVNPCIAIDSNGQSVWGVNQAFTHGINSTAQAKYVDIVWEENPDLRPDTDIDAIPRVTHKMRGMNLMRRLGKSVITAFKTDEEMSFNLTFSGNPGIYSRWGYAEPRKNALEEPGPGIQELSDFFNCHKNIYCGVKPLARIAVWRNQRSLALVNYDSHISACVMEHILFKRRIPFSIVQDEFITEEGLKDFDLLILPDAEYISETQLSVIFSFVKNGAALLVTEKSGAFNVDFRKRCNPAFAELFGGSFSGSSDSTEETANYDPNKQFSTAQKNGENITSTYGKGKCAYIGKIDYKYKPGVFQSKHNVHYNSIDSRYWKDPYNADEIVGMIEWLKTDLEPVKIYGHPEVRHDWVLFSDNSQGCLLMRCGELKGGVDMNFSILSGHIPKNSLLYLPEKKEPVKLSWQKNNCRHETILKSIMRHAIIKYEI